MILNEFKTDNLPNEACWRVLYEDTLPSALHRTTYRSFLFIVWSLFVFMVWFLCFITAFFFLFPKNYFSTPIFWSLCFGVCVCVLLNLVLTAFVTSCIDHCGLNQNFFLLLVLFVCLIQMNIKLT